MSQLRLAYVNCKLVSKNWKRTKRSSDISARSFEKSLPPLARKAIRLHKLKPRAAAVIEKLIDDVLSQIA